MMTFEKRSIGVCILLSIVTCGIYSIYWYYCIARDFYNSQTESNLSTTPGVTTILYFCTCHIYPIYAYYKWGKQTPEVYARYGQYGEDKSIMYLLLALFGFDIINMAVIQSDFNKYADMGPMPYMPGYGPYGAPPPPQGGYDPNYNNQNYNPQGYDNQGYNQQGYDPQQVPPPPPPPNYTPPEQAAPPPPIYQPPAEQAPPPPPPGSPYDSGTGGSDSNGSDS